MNQRKQEQLQHALRTAIQQVLARGLSDPRIRGLLTVTLGSGSSSSTPFKPFGYFGASTLMPDKSGYPSLVSATSSASCHLSSGSPPTPWRNNKIGACSIETPVLCPAERRTADYVHLEVLGCTRPCHRPGTRVGVRSQAQRRRS